MINAVQTLTGNARETGIQGLSAYEVYKKNGGTLSEEEWLVSLKGEKGDTGEQGIQGIQGDKGEKGDKGDKGEQGIQGIQGEKGEKGDKGDTGEQGIQGEKGEQGEKGDRGDSGGIAEITTNMDIATLSSGLYMVKQGVKLKYASSEITMENDTIINATETGGIVYVCWDFNNMFYSISTVGEYYRYSLYDLDNQKASKSFVNNAVANIPVLPIEYMETSLNSFVHNKNTIGFTGTARTDFSSLVVKATENFTKTGNILVCDKSYQDYTWFSVKKTGSSNGRNIIELKYVSYSPYMNSLTYPYDLYVGYATLTLNSDNSSWYSLTSTTEKYDLSTLATTDYVDNAIAALKTELTGGTE